jgi:hypothetical protein
MQQVYTQTVLSGLDETVVICLTRVTFTDGQWENDKWPIFVHARYYHSAARDVKYTNGGKPAEYVNNSNK